MNSRLTLQHDFPGRFGPGHVCLVSRDAPLCQVRLEVQPGSLHLLEDGGQDSAPVLELAELHGLAIRTVEAQVVAAAEEAGNGYSEEVDRL